jgi:hypothetical protein
MTAEEESEKAERGFTLGASSGPAEGDSGDAGMPKIDFSTFVISLGTSALYHMGIVNDPEQGEAQQKNLALARQTIDTLEMLAEKTRGNLGKQEAKLMESLLFELRMRFVEAGK